ncbi:MAG: NAD(P)H-binding protein [Dermatophilaceae bacterium]
MTGHEPAGERTLLTGATGYIGSRLAPLLVADGRPVRVLTRSRGRLAARSWAGRAEIIEGDATDGSDLARACAGVDVAYYLLHSMDGNGDFVARDRALASAFGEAAARAGVTRIVYLSGLHPAGQLSAHLASRVEVGGILMDSGVPTTVLQAAVIVGSGSASFEMLRHLTRNLPVMVAPKWLDSRIQPIAIRDVLHYLVAGARLDPSVNRTFDIGGPDVITYRTMITTYAMEAGIRRPWIQTVPVLTPRLASHWVGLVTPVPTGVAKPLIGSLVHEVVCAERHLDELVGPPDGGAMTFVESLRAVLAQPRPTGGSVTEPWRRPEPGTVDPAYLTSADPDWAG